MCMLKNENMSNTRESCVSTQDTFRLIEAEEKTSSVSALVSRLNTCSVSNSASGLKSDNPKSSKGDDQKEDKTIVQIFPWLPKINDLCRSSVGSKNIKTLENLLTVYLQKVTSSVKECYFKPIRAGKLKTCMNETLVFFHFLYQDIKESVDNTLYLEKMTELMAMYLDMEIKAARRRKESTKKVVSRMTSALNIFLDRSENHILDAIMKAKYITTNDKQICSPILEKLLTSLRTYNMQDTLYVRYLLVFKLWKKIVADANQRKEINKIAIARLPPPANFADRYKRFNNVLPRMPNSKNITTFYMQAKLNIRTACQNFMKISKDPMQPVVQDKPLFFDGRTQSTFSGKGNAFDGGVSRNLMNEIWSSFAEDNATSNKKTKDNSTAKKKTKKNTPEKKKKKKKTKSESTDTFSESNSPSTMSGSHLEKDSSSIPDPVTSSASVELTSARDLNFKMAAFTSARTSSSDPLSDLLPLPDSSTSSPGTSRLPSAFFEIQPLREQISTSHSTGVKPHPSYDCTVTSGMYDEDQKPCLGMLTSEGEIHRRENAAGRRSVLANDGVEIKMEAENHEPCCTDTVVKREVKPVIDDLFACSTTPLVNLKPTVVKKKQFIKAAVPVITIEDTSDPELDLIVGDMFKESDVQLGDQELPYVGEEEVVGEEVVEPCYPEQNDFLTRESDNRSRSSVSSVISSSMCDPVECPVVTSSHDDALPTVIERKQVRIPFNSCIPLNVRQDMLPPRLKVVPPHPVVMTPPAMPPSQPVISSSQEPTSSSLLYTGQLSPPSVSSPFVPVSAPQLVAYSQPPVEVPFPQPVTYPAPSPQEPVIPSQFKVPLPPQTPSPTKNPTQIAMPSFQSEVRHDDVAQLSAMNQPELYMPMMPPSHRLSEAHIPIPVDCFGSQVGFKFSPSDDFSFDDELSCCIPGYSDFMSEYINGDSYLPYAMIDPNMLDRRPLTEDEAVVVGPPLALNDPVELSNASNYLTNWNSVEDLLPSNKWSYPCSTSTPASMPFMADDDDEGYPSQYSEREYPTHADAAKAISEVMGTCDGSSQLNSVYRNSIPETCDKDNLGSSYRMMNTSLNSVNNSFLFEETGPNLRKSLESSEDSLPKSSLINSAVRMDPASSGQSILDTPVTPRSKNSVRQRNAPLVNRYDTPSSTLDMTHEHADLHKSLPRMSSVNKRPDMESVKADMLQASSIITACSVQLHRTPLRSKDISQGLIKGPSQGGSKRNVSSKRSASPTSSPTSVGRWRHDAFLGESSSLPDCELDTNYSPGKKIKSDDNKRPVTRSILKETKQKQNSSMPNTSRKKLGKLR